jgi:hypothetical protein
VKCRVSGFALDVVGDGWMGTNVLVVCTASLVGITGVAVQVALGGIVRCKDCFAEGALDEGLADDEAESAVVRP